MTAKIHILDGLLASKIAAGEVIERPASVVKELMENSLDAGADSVSVHVLEGGRRSIKIVDNGEGISREDVPLAFFRHATSKISTEEDLDAIRTMGFRGEALSSIASVARVTLRTRRRGEISGTRAVIEGALEPEVSDEGCPEGTSIEVRDIFFNTPARLKFLRSNESEFGRIADIFKRIALIHPEKRFKLVHGSGRPVEATPGGLKERIGDLFGMDTMKEMLAVDTPYVKGYIGSPALTYPASKYLYLYVNGRPIRDKGINRAIIDGYGQLSGDLRYPFAVLDIQIDPGDVDVNIHPTKSEVRFRNPKLIYDTVRLAVRGALAAGFSSPRPKAAFFSKTSVNTGYSRPPEPGMFAGEDAGAFSSSVAVTEETLPFFDTDGSVKTPELLGLEVIGQVWGEFLLAQTQASGGEFYIIDQHGAAERCAFESLKKQFFGGGPFKRQMLLLPERIETTPEEAAAVSEATEYFEKMGFEVMDFGPSGKFGGRTFLIKSVPPMLSSLSCGRLIKDLAVELSDHGGSARIEERIESALMTIACHSVIRGPRTLTKEEGRALLKEMAQVDFAGHCPHGRPVIKKITRTEVESMFKR